MKIIKMLILEIQIWVFAFLSSLPGRIGMGLRAFFLRPFFKKCGKRNYISAHMDVHGFNNISLGNHISAGKYLRIYAKGNGSEEIIIGDNVAFNENVMVNADCGGRVLIGNNVAVGPNVVLRASNHNYENKDVLIKEQGHKGDRIIIEDDVWIAANAVILPGVTIKKGAVIAAGAVVTKDVESYKVVAGVPAKVIAERK